MRSVLLFLLLPALAPAQSQPAPRPEDLGTVTGHITCADTQRPARLAQVRLIPVRNPTVDGPQSPTPVGSGINGPAVHTDLTGAYTIANVEPGRYYLRVDLTGYATPISQFTGDELKSPTPQVQQQIQRELQLVTVAPNSTTQADATIRRAGSISGTITFDDGSPAIGIGIGLFRHNADGKLQPVRNGTMTFTNGRGQFSIESLPSGEYVVDAQLNAFSRDSLTRIVNGKIQIIPAEMAMSFLPIYSGNVFRQKEAAAIKVDAGQQTDDADISIPLSRIHEISGTVLVKDGHPINSAHVELLDPDTLEPVASDYAGDEGAFYLHNVPEGSYILKVTSASDMGPLEVHYAPDHRTATTDRRPLHTYGDLQQPLTVQNDVQSLLLTVPGKPSAASATDSTGTN